MCIEVIPNEELQSFNVCWFNCFFNVFVFSAVLGQPTMPFGISLLQDSYLHWWEIPKGMQSVLERPKWCDYYDFMVAFLLPH